MRELQQILPPAVISQLENGMRLVVLREPSTPVVATTLIYRAGTRDDPPDHTGTAHFLEHMMFKGAPRYPIGEIDRLTRALGGSNNAFTSHDLTIYYFHFAADRWERALDIESDRMAALDLDRDEVQSERQVILEEIAMYESEPWDALEQRVARQAFRGHPYARPVLGTRPELEAIDVEVLRDFHRQLYGPANAILVIAGDVDDRVREKVEETFGALAGRVASRPDRAVVEPPRGLVRLERRAGEIARLLLSLPVPAARHPDHPLLRLLVTVLGTGRSSRLHRALVDEGQICVGISADVNESLDPGALSVALEVMPDVEPRRAEEALLAELTRLRREPPSAEEVERAKKLVLADWIFDHERVHQQGMLLGTALALFDLDHPWRYHERLFAASREELAEIAERYLAPERSAVLGWSLPAESQA